MISQKLMGWLSHHSLQLCFPHNNPRDPGVVITMLDLYETGRLEQSINIGRLIDANFNQQPAAGDKNFSGLISQLTIGS